MKNGYKILVLLIGGVILLTQGCKKDMHLTTDRSEDLKQLHKSSMGIKTLAYSDLQKARSAEQSNFEQILAQIKGVNINRDSVRLLQWGEKTTYIFRVQNQAITDTVFQNISITDSAAVLYTYYLDAVWRYYKSLGYVTPFVGEVRAETLFGQPHSNQTSRRNASGNCVTYVIFEAVGHPCEGATDRETGKHLFHLPGESNCVHEGTEKAAGIDYYKSIKIITSGDCNDRKPAIHRPEDLPRGFQGPIPVVPTTPYPAAGGGKGANELDIKKIKDLKLRQYIQKLTYRGSDLLRYIYSKGFSEESEEIAKLIANFFYFEPYLTWEKFTEDFYIYKYPQYVKILLEYMNDSHFSLESRKIAKQKMEVWGIDSFRAEQFENWFVLLSGEGILVKNYQQDNFPISNALIVEANKIVDKYFNPYQNKANIWSKCNSEMMRFLLSDTGRKLFKNTTAGHIQTFQLTIEAIWQENTYLTFAESSHQKHNTYKQRISAAPNPAEKAKIIEEKSEYVRSELLKLQLVSEGLFEWFTGMIGFSNPRIMPSFKNKVASFRIVRSATDEIYTVQKHYYKSMEKHYFYGLKFEERKFWRNGQ